MDQSMTLQDLAPCAGTRTMLILVGLVASGKSTFAQALERHFPLQFRRCNQDELGTRQRVESLAHRTLREGLSPCIDRTNVDALQRSHWINIARSFPGTSISVIVFDTPYQVCSSRLWERSSHPTIKDPQQGQSILARFASDLQFPQPNEGHDHILYLKPSDHLHPEYTREDIDLILQRLHDSSPDFKWGNVQPPMQASFTSASSPPIHTRGRGYRGRYAHRGGRNHPFWFNRLPQSYSRRGDNDRGGTSRTVDSETYLTSGHEDSDRGHYGSHGAVRGVS
ncbi:P-loop containing nucleoside triphosphate hydrolase protein [Suillus paluster]|uniref:P-loop containing nucleoside triphosphate hydrolase protein n=1 Tax=Suillus paluster TaxID=48578 RepID=UPI001B8749B0|nr:P-loop containing nucleoside triphosphate hydrolase protein [Suillus paluster]KAG1746676.1 P-loop containing nucleoside triphosphate hydrolase protein [Suillus paluster]